MFERPSQHSSEDRTYAFNIPDSRLGSMLFDGSCEARDGCRVEPDGICPHGCWSPLVVLDLI